MSIEFEDKELFNFKIDNSPEKAAQLIVHYLCGRKDIPKLDTVENELISALLKNAEKKKIDASQFNELLLLLRQDKIEPGFFSFFFNETPIDLNELIKGVSKFRVYALLCFGNFRFAYKKLSKLKKEEIEKTLYPYCENSCSLEGGYSNRREKMLEIEKIQKEKTWLLGSITGPKVEKEGAKIKKKIDEDPKWEKYGGQISKLADDIVNTRNIAFKNTDIYLTWDHMDVYIATSMRNKWEYEETFDFITSLFENKLIGMNLRFFDPTQSLCKNSRDKGLVEGLMLKRARCTIYLAQENDTMGKDSELATTLAQSKPVIAYVPEINVEEYAEKISSFPLEYFRKRILLLDAEGIFDEEDFQHIIKSKYPNFEEIINEFIKELGSHRDAQPFILFPDLDMKFKQKEIFQKICTIIANAEKINYDIRAKILRGVHPLSMQVDLNTGVANGVLVVRNIAKCSEVMRKILTNKMKFEIQSEEGFTVLVETTSKSPHRVVTKNERLTNSFWNFYR